MDFEPHPLIRSPHLQTLLSSRLARQFDGVGSALTSAAERVEVPCRDGVRLHAVINRGAEGAPLVVLMHGWFGRADSPYLRGSTTALHAAGFAVARLLLRDHDGTAALNEAIFHGGRVDEVADGIRWLVTRYGSNGAGLMGYSLGGNLLIRALAQGGWPASIRSALVVCPVIDPGQVIEHLDRGWAGYRAYFMRKWRRALAEKQAAFPHLYDFEPASRLSLAGSLTDYFVARYTPYVSSREYFKAQTVEPSHLDVLDVPLRILAAEDDPVVPVAGLRRLARHRHDLVRLTPHGGHCAFIEDFRLRSALDRHAVSYFEATVRESPC
ncbi:MAG: alpha/beta fold hydrolase [Pseudomonadales bacterium]